MSDNRRRFVAIYKAIKKLYPVEPRGNLARHLTTLAMLISGIVASKRVNLPAIASKVPTMAKVESQVKRFSRKTLFSLRILRRPHLRNSRSGLVGVSLYLQLL